MSLCSFGAHRRIHISQLRAVIESGSLTTIFFFLVHFTPESCWDDSFHAQPFLSFFSFSSAVFLFIVPILSALSSTSSLHHPSEACDGQIYYSEMLFNAHKIISKFAPLRLTAHKRYRSLGGGRNEVDRDGAAPADAEQ